MKILIAEDDPVSRRILEATLLKWGYNVWVANDGTQAWEILQSENAPTLAILDIMMPGLNGFEVFDRVRSDTDIRDMPVLFVSAATNQYDGDFTKRGIKDVISKPFDLNDLLDRVRVLCPADAGGQD